MTGIYVFDAYGTLFNLHAAAERHRDAIGPEWQRFSHTWRTKHIEYTWHATMLGRKPTFWELARAGLDYAIAAHALPVAPQTQDALMAAYRRMQVYPEVPEVLAALRARGDKLAILSNGDPDMLADAIASAGIEGALDAVLSVASVGAFKPAPEVYRLATDRFACAAADISFQSSNRWDIAAAKAAGMRCVWINRTGAPDEYVDLAPDRVVSDLRALLS
ncbi:MAG: haloacid dehalogenase type II [Hyphomicrobiaceae bacterium]|nr:haloacid dehalogenase type II [Hyphomicrobiaceae bacterium]